MAGILAYIWDEMGTFACPREIAIKDKRVALVHRLPFDCVQPPLIMFLRRISQVLCLTYVVYTTVSSTPIHTYLTPI